jgi:hypothetical protein
VATDIPNFRESLITNYGGNWFSDFNPHSGYSIDIPSKTTSSVTVSPTISSETTSISINYTGDGDTRPIKRRFIIWKRTG